METRVLIVDDQPVVRRGFNTFLRGEVGIQVVGEASSGLEAVEVAALLKPHVILMDIRMPEGNGLWAAQKILKNTPSIKVIIMTTFDLDSYLFGALDLGAAGFILKDCDPEEIIDSIHKVVKGGCAVSQSLVGRLVSEFSRRKDPTCSPLQTSAIQATQHHPLTSREIEVVHLLSEGRTNDEIARELQVEITTIKAHVGKVASKLGLDNRVQIVIWAFASGITVPRLI